MGGPERSAANQFQSGLELFASLNLEPESPEVSWLIKDPKELDQIVSPDLKSEIELLLTDIASKMTSAKSLKDYYVKLANLVREERARLGETRQFMLRMGQRIESLEEGQSESIKDLKDLDFEGKTVASKLLLEEIESGCERIRSPHNADKTKSLERLLRETEFRNTPFAKEIKARLRLQETWALLSDAESLSEGVPIEQGYERVARMLADSKLSLQGADFYKFFIEGCEGLKVAEAFSFLQEAAFLGIEIGGKRKRPWQKGITEEEQEQIKENLIGILGGGERAEKSLQLATRIARVTLETSVWNRSLIGKDPLAEAIYFEQYRTERAEAARDRGPSITIDRIKGFGTSYFRSAQTLNQIKIWDVDKNVYLFLPEDEDHPAYLTDVQGAKPRLLATFRRNRGELPGFDVTKSPADQPDKVEMLPIKELEYNLIRPDEYTTWLGETVAGYLVFKSLCLKTTWKREDFSSDAIESYVAPSNAADPEQVLRLRSEFILGVFWSIYKRGEAVNLGWDAPALGIAEAHLTSRIKTKKGTLPAYLAPKQLEWVENTLRKHYHLGIHHRAAMVGVLNALTNRTIIS